MDTLTIVTGGSAGLGRALLDTAPAGSFRVDVSRSGHEAADVHLELDLADPDRWPEACAAIGDLVRSQAWTRITCVHSAGTLTPIGFAGEVDADAYTRNVLLNAAAPQVLGHGFLAAVGELPDVRRELVLLSSGAARTAYPGWSSYGAAKAAVDQWVRTVGAEQQQRGGVQVLAVAPGVVATGMQELIRQTDARDFPNVARFHDLHASGALVAPSDAAAALWRLLDDRSVPTGAIVDLRDR